MTLYFEIQSEALPSGVDSRLLVLTEGGDLAMLAVEASQHDIKCVLRFVPRCSYSLPFVYSRAGCRPTHGVRGLTVPVRQKTVVSPMH